MHTDAAPSAQPTTDDTCATTSSKIERSSHGTVWDRVPVVPVTTECCGWSVNNREVTPSVALPNTVARTSPMSIVTGS